MQTARDPARHDGPGLLGAVRRHPSAVLLVAQLLAVLAYPFLDDSTRVGPLLGLVGTGARAGRGLGRPPHARAGLDRGASRRAGDDLHACSRRSSPTTDAIVLGSALLHAPFYFYVSYGMIRYLFHDDRVTRDELYATGAAFTVVAWGFAYVFVAVRSCGPDSFVGNAATATAHVVRAAVPLVHHAHQRRAVRHRARCWRTPARVVMVEQVVGVLYIALVVARLVGLTVVRARPPTDQTPT